MTDRIKIRHDPPMNQHLSIEKSGVIQGGYCKLTAWDNGLIAYEGEIAVKIGFFTKKHKFSGQKTVDPDAIRSASYAKVGTLRYGDLRIDVQDVLATDSSCRLEISQIGLAGPVTVSRIKNLVMVVSASLNFNYLGMRLHLKLHNS